MNPQQSQIVATKTILILFERNCNDVQMESVKSLLNIFVIEKQLPQSEMVLVRVNPDAVLLKSTKLVEKGFPMGYFIQSKKFLGVHEITSSPIRVNELIHSPPNVEAIEGLQTFFRGCEIIDNPNLVEALQIATVSKEGDLSASKLDVGLTSKVIENTLWSMKWGVNSAWNYTSSLISAYAGTTEQPKLLNEDEESGNAPHIDIEAIRTNWYSRPQRRKYRFYDNHFERIDPKGSMDGTEVIKAAYKYSDVAKISIENSEDLIIHFRDSRLGAQWLHTGSPDANKIINIICSRAPWTASVAVIRNLETKMSKLNVFTAKLEIALPAHGIPRWKKDGLAIAFQDEISWKTIDLETVSLALSEFSALDLTHFLDEYISHKMVLPLGTAANPKARVITPEDLDSDYIEISTTPIPYTEGNGLRTQYGGYVAEMVDAMGPHCVLFVSKENSTTTTQWKKNQEKLFLFQKKCGAPIMSPDGKFAAFLDEEGNIFIHRTDFLSESQYLSLQTEVDLEDILYDSKARPKIVRKQSLQVRSASSSDVVPTELPTPSPPKTSPSREKMIAN